MPLRDLRPSTKANHYRDEKNAFKRKLEGCKSRRGKFEAENTRKGETWQNSNYEPTNIDSTYDSIYFKWRRIKEYFKETEDIYLDKAINEAKIIMNS